MNGNASQQPSQPPGCRVVQVSVTSGEHRETLLVEGEEYFFVLLKPKDPKSFVRLSGFATAARRVPLDDQKPLNPNPDAPRDGSESVAAGPAPTGSAAAVSFGETIPPQFVVSPLPFTDILPWQFLDLGFPHRATSRSEKDNGMRLRARGI